MPQFRLWHRCATVAAIAAGLGFGRVVWQDPKWLFLVADVLSTFLISMLVLIVKDKVVLLWCDISLDAPTRNARLARHALSAAKFTVMFWIGLMLLVFAVAFILHWTL